MARFRCCGSYTTEGHHRDCPLKPSAVDVEEKGCQFDIMHFKHIGECKHTCDGQGDGIKQYAEIQTGNKLTIVLVDMSNATEEDLKELEENGLKLLSEQEIGDIISKCEAGELEVGIQTMTLAEALAKSKKDEPKPDPYMDIKEAAKALQFSLGWTRTLCRKGKLEGAIKLDRVWAIPRSAIYMEDD